MTQSLDQFLVLPEELFLILGFAWQIIATWWWLILPFLFLGFLKKQYLFWLNERWYKKNVKPILLEIKMPRQVLRPIRAMDEVFAGIHSIHDVIDFREKWVEGLFQLSISCEIVSLGGKVHFYIRTPEFFRDIVESNIYSQYPDAEISLVDDYTKHIPRDIPNKEWDIFGCNFVFSGSDVYPIKTYSKFEDQTQLEIHKERKIDPLAGLLEGMTTIGPGEQFWLQFIFKPIRDENPWRTRIRNEIDSITKRKKPEPSKSIIQEAAEIIISGQQKPKEAGPVFSGPSLIPGEIVKLDGLEEKISKFAFSCFIRFIYLGKREVFHKPKARFVFGFFKEISTENLGGIKIWKKTMTKVKSVFFWFLDKRRLYLRKRKIFRFYKMRVPPLFPNPGGTFVINTEEAATLFHIPSGLISSVSTVPRVGIKKGEAPLDLPIG